MYRLASLLLIFVTLIVTGGAIGQTVQKNVLIVYLSRTNNTKAVAEIIHSYVGGNLISLELQNPYPEDYQKTVQQVARENESGYLPTLRTKIDNISSFDIVFVGFPTWGMQLPPPVKSFFNQYSRVEKTVVPFNTNAGYGVGTAFDQVKRLCPQSKVVEGFVTQGGIERDGKLLSIEGERLNEVQKDVHAWLNRLKSRKDI